MRNLKSYFMVTLVIGLMVFNPASDVFAAPKRIKKQENRDGQWDRKIKHNAQIRLLFKTLYYMENRLRELEGIGGDANVGKFKKNLKNCYKVKKAKDCKLNKDL